ncbi:hypothetical protein [Planomonospora sp. ID82291]|uniref:hypothetical protein n=1 Tax=Planomonospora sp. ID82291 TaxID=2738136 RepID=UPI0018C37D86|nr:hypothetical protein [Planomonospora sp. ID82291]MBG0818311.1 hypothetical protein [Planomonospora sp. ID82291]
MATVTTDSLLTALRTHLDRAGFYSLARLYDNDSAIRDQLRPLPCPPPCAPPPGDRAARWAEVVVRGHGSEFATVLVSLCPHGEPHFDVFPDHSDPGHDEATKAAVAAQDTAAVRTFTFTRDAADHLRHLFR